MKSRSTAPIRVGVLLSETGVTSVIERSERQGKLLAVQEINEAGRGLSEDDTYKIIRDQAMSKRVTAGEIADAVINANEILGFDLKS